MSSYNSQKVTSSVAEKLLLEHYGIHGKATLLAGESVFNYRIQSKTGEQYVLKISRPSEDESYLDFQNQLLVHIEKTAPDFLAPRLIRNQLGNGISSFEDQGESRQIRLLTWVEGRMWHEVNPHSKDLREKLGQIGGKLSTLLQGFEHPQIHRSFDWDIAKAEWTSGHLNLFEPEKKALVLHFQDRFKKNHKDYIRLRKSVVHNDVNDHNIVVSHDLLSPKIKAIIDFGDCIYTQVINDLAICCAYAITKYNNPLEAALPIIKGYHSEFALEEKELAHLYDAIAMRLVISVTKSAINRKAEPDNDYLLISEKNSWELLIKWGAISPEFAHYSFRKACNYTAHPNEGAFKHWAENQKISLLDILPSVGLIDVLPIDLSIGSQWLGHPSDYMNLDLFQFRINQRQKETPADMIAGGYLEVRSVYKSDNFIEKGNNGEIHRNLHLGVDFWLPFFTPVHAFMDGEIQAAHNDTEAQGFGGLIILKHSIGTFNFYSLYGHLAPLSIRNHKVGDKIKKGQYLGELGSYPENGNWPSHLHFQLMLSLLDYGKDFIGVAYYDQKEVWKSICPDPNLLFKSKGLETKEAESNQDLINYRKKHLGKGLSLQYKEPLKILRGIGQYLVSDQGRMYLDTVNNVAHVGHEHHAVVKAGREQMAVLNTNSRYLHDNIKLLAEELLQTLPPELCVVHFVNSGSEANELALRMAKAATGQRDIIASEMGYHGNSNACIDISSYKFDGKGGSGAPEHTQVFPLPDSYRGKYQGENTAKKYAQEVQQCISNIQAKGRGVAAMIIEPIISCGGQIVLPEGFLEESYSIVRQAGGVCISDEVQVGCGRIGKAFWGFQLHNVLPDIITIGKPLGNGHPLAAVVCTREVADGFNNGMEYFNTFGGNPVSCAIGLAVLQTVKGENLQENARKIGSFIKSGIQELSNEFPIIGDVRGEGLFLGIELVSKNKKPLPIHTEYLVDRMKDYGILMSIDGPDNNVLKIKPPLVFSKKNAEELLYYLKKVLLEDFMFKFEL